MSRPNWSVPSRWPGVSGGASGCSTSMCGRATGWRAPGASRMATIAIASIVRPAISVIRRRSCSGALGRPLATLSRLCAGPCISSSDGLAAHRDAHSPISCPTRGSSAAWVMSVSRLMSDDQHREQQRDALHHRVVPVGHRVDQQRAEAGQREHVLHQHGPADQVGQVDAEHRDDREHGVAEHVPAQHLRQRDALHPVRCRRTRPARSRSWPRAGCGPARWRSPQRSLSRAGTGSTGARRSQRRSR